MNIPKLGSLWMLVAALGFAIMGALVKVGAAKFSSPELVFYRSAFGLIVIYGFIISRKLSIQTKFIQKHFARSSIGFASLVLFFYAIAHLPLATAITLNYTSPLFLATFMPFFLHEKPKKIFYLTLSIGFIGAALILKPTFTNQDVVPGILGLCSGAGAGLAYILIKQLGNLNEPDWRTVFYFTLISTIGAGLLMLFDQFTTVTWQDLPVLIGLGVSATLAQLAITRAYRTGHTLTVASLSYTTVVIASLFGMLFWQECLALDEWLGVALIMMGGIISTRTNSSQTRSIQTDSADRLAK